VWAEPTCDQIGFDKIRIAAAFRFDLDRMRGASYISEIACRAQPFYSMQGHIIMNVIHTDQAPAAIGPYSQGIEAAGLVFTSGQLPIDPKTGEMPAGPADQARQSMKNVLAVLKAAGSGLEKAVKVTIFLRDLEHFGAVNEVYAGFFNERFPARSCVQAARLPKDALVEIEAIALK
jgi:2-iminobutanoate/2-iminopropanoate deaminase